MIKTNEMAHDYRFGDNGPKYLIRGPMCDMGVVVLQPGQSFRNHRHKEVCEVFYTLSGEVCLYLEGAMQMLREGDVLQCDTGSVPWKGVFVKSPHVLGDSHPAEPESY